MTPKIADWEALPILRAMVLADGSGWELFSADKAIDEQRRTYIMIAFEDIKRKILD